MAEDHGHEGAAEIGRGHLQADDRGAVACAEVAGRHVLDGGIHRAHARADDDKARCRHKIAPRGEKHQRNAGKLHRDAETNEAPVPKPVRDEARDEPAEHQAAEDERAAGRHFRVAQIRAGAGKIAGRPEKAGGLAGAVGEKGRKRRQDAGHAQGLPDARALTQFLFVPGAVLPLPHGQRQHHHKQDAHLDIRGPAVALVPARRTQGKGHDRGADDRAHAVEAVQEIHDGGGIVTCHIVVDGGVDGTGAEAVGHCEDKEHPVPCAE